MKNIVTFPCAVGSTVYLPEIDEFGNLITYTVSEVGLDRDGVFFRVDDEDQEKLRGKEIGTSLYFTKLQAEQRLAELQSERSSDSLYIGALVWYSEGAEVSEGRIVSLRRPAPNAPSWDHGAVGVQFSDGGPDFDFSLSLLGKRLFTSKTEAEQRR